MGGLLRRDQPLRVALASRTVVSVPPCRADLENSTGRSSFASIRVRTHNETVEIMRRLESSAPQDEGNRPHREAHGNQNEGPLEHVHVANGNRSPARTCSCGAMRRLDAARQRDPAVVLRLAELPAALDRHCVRQRKRPGTVEVPGPALSSRLTESNC